QHNVHREEYDDLVEDVLEAARLVAVGGGDGVAVHRIGHPGHLGPGGAHPFDQCGQAIPDVPGAHAGDERQPAGFAVRVEAVDQPQRVVGRGGGPELHPDRIAQTRHEDEGRAWELPRVLPHPQEVPGAAADLPGARVDAGERLLVVQQQGRVEGVELHDLQRIEVRAERVHEAHALVDLPGQLLVAVVPGTG